MRTIEETLAAEFTRVLRTWLTADEWEDMVARNTAETRRHICHSHDFCDANMAMEEASYAVLGHALTAEADDPIQAEIDLDIWNRAWDIAKAQWRGSPICSDCEAVLEEADLYGRCSTCQRIHDAGENSRC